MRWPLFGDQEEAFLVDLSAVECIAVVPCFSAFMLETKTALKPLEAEREITLSSALQSEVLGSYHEYTCNKHALA